MKKLIYGSIGFLVLGVFFFSLSAHAAITFDTATSISGVSTTTNKSITIGSGSNEALIIQVGGRCALTGVTVGGTNATFVASGTSSGNKLFEYYFLGLSSGSVSVTSTCSASANIAMSLASFFGVNQSTPIDTTGATSTGNNTNPSSNVTTTVQNDLLVDSVVFQTSTSSPSAGQTQIAALTGGTCPTCEGILSSYKIVTSTQQYTMSWATTTVGWTDFTTAFEPSVAAVSFTIPDIMPVCMD